MPGQASLYSWGLARWRLLCCECGIPTDDMQAAGRHNEFVVSSPGDLANGENSLLLLLLLLLLL